MSRETHADVVVLGGGPTGLAAAHLLSRHGVTVALVEQRPGSARHPRATIVNVRTMEILRGLGLIDEVTAAGIAPQSAARITWATSLAGPEIGHLDVVESAAQLMRMAQQSPVLPGICPQNRLEAILVGALSRRPAVEARFGCRATGLVADDNGVTLTAVSGDDEVRVHGRYAILAEGVRGDLRAQLEIGQWSARPLGTLRDIHFRADLSRWTAQRPSALHWVVNPLARGVLIAVDPRQGEWLLEVPDAGGDGGPDPVVDDRRLVGAAIGADVDATILSVRRWSMGTTGVDRWRDPSGRVFVAGDAAHTFPPTGGFGMNTGIQDVHNLSWKLAGVLRGWADEALLAGYERERRPVADFNAAQSEHNARQTRIFLEDEAGPLLGSLAVDGPAGVAARAGLAALIPAQRPHFDYPGQALGFRYPDGDDDGAPVVDDVAEYRPSLRAGGRVPHHWLDAAHRTSTVDLGETGFSLLTDLAAVPRWAAVAEAGRPAGVPLAVVGVPGPGFTADGVLLRPDGHIAAVLTDQAPAAHLRQALERACGFRMTEGVAV